MKLCKGDCRKKYVEKIWFLNTPCVIVPEVTKTNVKTSLSSQLKSCYFFLFGVNADISNACSYVKLTDASYAKKCLN